METRNLSMCEYLNLKGSSFESIEANWLLKLKFIDISSTKIKKACFTNCKYLKKSVVDKS